MKIENKRKENNVSLLINFYAVDAVRLVFSLLFRSYLVSLSGLMCFCFVFVLKNEKNSFNLEDWKMKPPLVISLTLNLPFRFHKTIVIQLFFLQKNYTE